MNPTDPFLNDVYAENSTDIEDIHHTEFESVLGAFEVHQKAQKMGQTVVLLAPRAGYGKSHLLARITRQLQGDALPVPLHFKPELSFSWKRLCADSIRHLRESVIVREEASCSSLEVIARRFLAEFLLFALREGAIGEEVDDLSEELLHESAVSLFDPDPESGISLSGWFVPRFESLLDELGGSFAKLLDLEVGTLEQWARFLFDENYCKPSFLACDSEGVAFQHFVALGRIAALESPLLFLIDHLDGLEGESGHGKRVAHILCSLADSIPQSFSILSVNRDTWSDLFVRHTPTAFSDRLSRDTIELEPLSLVQAEHLVCSRIADQGMSDHEANAFLNSVNLADLSSSVQANAFTPRTIIRFARRCWERFEESGGSQVQQPSKTVPFPAETVGSGSVSTKGLSPADKLAALAESLRQQGIQRVRHEPESFLVQPDKTQTLAGSFQEILVRISNQSEASFDARRVLKVVKEIGANFDLITQTELMLAQNANGGALCWEVEGREILIGFGSNADHDFWQGLAELARKRFQNSNHQAWVKLAILSPNCAPFQLGQDLWGPNAEHGQLPMVDVIEIDHEVLSGLYAAEELIARHSQGDTPYSSRDIFAFLATELDYFWQKMTRRSGSAGSSAVAG